MKQYKQDIKIVHNLGRCHTGLKDLSSAEFLVIEQAEDTKLEFKSVYTISHVHY